MGSEMCIRDRPNFVQRELNEGQPATERTEVAMLYNEQNLYIGFWGYDSKPGQITATQMERDYDWRSGKYLSFSADYEYNTFDLSGGHSMFTKLVWRFAL